MATINICDICGTKENVTRIWFVTGRSMDAAGSMDDDGETFDLCTAHQLSVYINAVHRLGIEKHKLNAAIIEDIKKRIRTNK